MTLLELLDLIKKHLRTVIILPLICALAVGIYSVLFMRDRYTASTNLYVLTKPADGAESSFSASDLNASQMISNDVSNLIKSSRVVRETSEKLGIEDLSNYKTDVTSSTTTRVITLKVTGSNAENVALVANAMAESTSSVAQEVMNLQSVNVIDEAVAPTSPSGPNRLLYVAAAAVAGLFAAIALIVLRDMLNTRINSQEELEELLGVPVVGRIPQMKGGM